MRVLRWILVVGLATLPLASSGCGGEDAYDDYDEFGEEADLPDNDPEMADSEPEAADSGEPRSAVIVNGERVDDRTLQSLQTQYGIQVADGSYWYDAYSGAFGQAGGPAIGFTMPNLDLGGRLGPDASGGGTNVWVNGRELHPQDVYSLQALLGPVYPGRYWLDGNGWYGVEGGPASGNLIFMASQAAPGGPGYNRSTYGGHLGSDGSTSYYFDPSSGCSVISGGGVSC